MVASTRPTMRALDSLFCAPTVAGFKPMGKREGAASYIYLRRAREAWLPRISGGYNGGDYGVLVEKIGPTRRAHCQRD